MSPPERFEHVPELKKDGPRSASDVIRVGCEESLAALKQYHADAIELEAEPVHKIRVGTRRLRAMLRIFAEILDEQWSRELEEELRWLAQLLGAVRDLDVLRERLRNEAEPGERRTMIYVQRILAGRHREAQSAMREGLKSERYDALRKRLHEGMLAPQVTLEAGGPARDVLLPKLHEAWKKLARDARKLNDGDEATAYHHVRKSGKRIRYAAEMLQLDLEQDAANEADRFVKRMKKLQDTLGELQDSVVAAQTLEQLLELGSFHGTGIRTLIDAEKKAEQKARDKFPERWRRASKKRHRSWMKPK